MADLLGAGPEPRGQEAEVGERSPDGGGLGVLEAGDGVDLAIAHPLGGPARGGRLTVVRGAVDGGAEDDLLLGVLNQLGEDAAGRVLLIEELDARGHRRVALGVEIVGAFRHEDDTAGVIGGGPA